jgi:hypothetical protein
MLAVVSDLRCYFNGRGREDAISPQAARPVRPPTVQILDSVN